MWKIRADFQSERVDNIRKVQESFRSLQGLEPGLVALDIEADISGVTYGCDVVLVTDFESREALEAYANHPEHLRVKNEIIDLRTDRYQVD
ncbi:Dabb family protein [Caballeronia sordidicola]|uniref:Dabb family protein n=1 Tax=Caballeronia sordidicola TaxID=196367 RepID=UPI000B77F0EC|nr:Dabb family protein [Caballeronia sordidicola]